MVVRCLHCFQIMPESILQDVWVLGVKFKTCLLCFWHSWNTFHLSNALCNASGPSYNYRKIQTAQGVNRMLLFSADQFSYIIYYYYYCVRQSGECILFESFQISLGYWLWCHVISGFGHTWPRSHTISLDIVQLSRNHSRRENTDRTHLPNLWLLLVFFLPV